MTRGIQLKALSATDLDYLGLPPDLLQGAMDLIDRELDAHGETAPSDRIDALAITREVRCTMEEVLQLLTEALPATHR
jgi:hypothetical protein